jgi:predicted phage gp36 major capsid-like protein
MHLDEVELLRRMNALEQRQDEWMAKSNRTLDELRAETERTLRELKRLMRTIDELV